MGRQTPDGYSMLSNPWMNSSALLESMNFSLALAGNRLSKGVTADWLGQLGAVSLVPDLEERQIENLLMHGQVSEKTRALILQQLDQSCDPQPSRQRSGNLRTERKPIRPIARQPSRRA